MELASRARHTVEVEVTPAYPVWVGQGLMSEIGSFISESCLALTSDEVVYELYGEAVKGALEAAGKTVSVHTFPSGEASKSLKMHAELLGQLVRAGLDRKSAVVALGGGVVGDLSGYVAASFMRGIAFYQVPTSLLAMVDASVGGKTGVNLPEGKNLVGAFWQPKAVFADMNHLRSLSSKQFKEGAAEHFKHGLLADPHILENVAKPDFQVKGDAGFLAETVARSVRVKAEIVAADVREAGRRAHLNLGHTLAHALEAVTRHALSHGEAVAYGLLFNAYLAAARGYADETERARAFLRYLSPSPLPDVSLSELLTYMRRDKKTAGGHLRFVLLREVGSPFIVDDVSGAELGAAWQKLKAAI